MASFYRAMHVVLRGIAIVSPPSVRLYVRLSVCDVDVPWAYVLG